jgi:c-di-GMP-binding flagellar brake protein YcgR
MDYQQNREYFRVKLQESASITYEKNEEQKQISVLTYDISAKGVCIELDEQVDFPEEVILSLFFPDKKIEVKGKYVRTDVEDNIIKASFQFDDIPQADLDYISQICFKKQLEERRKNLLG